MGHYFDFASCIIPTYWYFVFILLGLPFLSLFIIIIIHPLKTVSWYMFKLKKLLQNRAICDIFLQFNVLRWNNNVLVHWCWLLLLLLVGFCHCVNFLAVGFLPHSTVVYHSTNQCSKDEWNSTGDNCCYGNTHGIWGADIAAFITGSCTKVMKCMQ